MIRFNPSPTERTTSATDGILAIQTGLMAAFLMANPAMYGFKGYLWIGFFVAVCLTSVFGAVAHGFYMNKRTNDILWQILTLCFSVCYILLITSLCYDLFGLPVAKIAFICCALLGAALVVVCIKSPAFVQKIIYIGVGIGVAILGAGLWSAFVLKIPGAALFLAAMVLASLATIVEARQKFRIRLIWEFDHHSGYHFLQFFSNICLFLATRAFFGI